MNYFNIDFDTIASKDGLKNKKEFFSFRLSAKQFGLNPGPYVIYPGMTDRELICIPMYRFKELEEKFYKLSEKRNNSDHEKSVKQKNNKEKNIQEKRIKFYEKSKFKVLKNLRAKPYTVNFKIMIYELQKADIKEIENNIREFYYAVIDKKMQKYITVKNDLEDEEKKQKGNE